ncbi:MAG: hypothetical protein KF819_05785 [Labilithrix sp.]|nr:hypothetical protein [Labilithrix sp.]
MVAQVPGERELVNAPLPDLRWVDLFPRELVRALEQRGDPMRAVHGGDTLEGFAQVAPYSAHEERILALPAKKRERVRRAAKGTLRHADQSMRAAKGGVQVRAESWATRIEPYVAIHDDGVDADVEAP